jgi:hypothetical protein
MKRLRRGQEYGGRIHIQREALRLERMREENTCTILVGKPEEKRASMM